jgi:ankyrin repeat protein
MNHTRLLLILSLFAQLNQLHAAAAASNQEEFYSSRAKLSDVGEAIRSGNPDLLRKLLDKKADPHQAHVCDNLVPPIHIAVGYGQAECLRILLAAGAPINISLIENVTPLHLAAGLGKIDTVNILLEADAFVDQVTDEDGYTALHYAIKEEKIECVDALLAAHADVNIKTNNSENPLSLAVHTNNLQIVLSLLRHKATVNIVEGYQRNILESMLTDNSVDRCQELFALLLSYGADCDLTHNKTTTLLHKVLELRRPNFQRKNDYEARNMLYNLLEEGADLHVSTYLYPPILEYAVQREDHEAAEIILQEIKRRVSAQPEKERKAAVCELLWDETELQEFELAKQYIFPLYQSSRDKRLEAIQER